MKIALIALLLLASNWVQAQCLSLRELLLLAEKADKEPFQQGGGAQTSGVQKILREGGFANVRWRADDPDMERNLASSKAYSRRTDAFLIFQADAHGRLLENLVYRVRSTACVAQFRKQLLAAGFTIHPAKVVPDENPDAVSTHFSPYNLYCTNPTYSVTITGEVDATGKDLHRYSVIIYRAAAMEQMQAEINAVNMGAPEADQAKPLPKSQQRKSVKSQQREPVGRVRP